MCAFLENVSVTARELSAAGDVDFCKLISPVRSVSGKLFIKSLPRSDAIKWICGNISSYRFDCVFVIFVSKKTITLDPNKHITPQMVVKLQDSCVGVGVPHNNWSTGVACCPNCRHELLVSLACPKNHIHSPVTPSTPPFSIQPTYLPHSPLYTTPTSPLIPSAYNDELRRLADTLRALRISGWYYGNLDWQGAQNLLKDASVGAFLIRDSGDRNFIFSLSVQTEKGPTSVRLHYEQGFFRLDCDRPLARYMPRFRSVLELVQHYTRVGQQGAAGTVWVDREGCPHSPVLLKVPLKKSPPSLLHLARLAIHKTLDSNPLTPKLSSAPRHRLLRLPSTLLDYLGEYPYSV